MPSDGEKYYVISSLGKGLRVLEILADHGELGVSVLAAHLQSNRASCHRFLLTLRDLGYVEKTEEGRYRLTFKVAELGMKKLGQFEIRHIARPLMQELATAFGETVNLGYWDRGVIVHLDKIDSTEILRMDSGLGTGAPAYCTGLGKAILAFLPAEEVASYLQRVEFRQMTPNTITSVAAMQTELEKVRKTGFAIDNEELSIGLRCVAAPIFDYAGRPRFALSISGPTHRISDAKIDPMASNLKEVCQRLTEKMGGAGSQKRSAR